jgi:hypothetical protein
MATLQSYDELFTEHQQLARGTNAFSAMVRLGEILLRCRHDTQKPDVAKAWESPIRRAVSSDVAESARAQAAQAWRKTTKILAYGDTWEWDEVVLILTERISLELACSALELVGVDTSSIDVARAAYIHISAGHVELTWLA